MNLKKGGHVVELEKKVQTIICILDWFSPLLYFLMWVLLPATAGLLPALRTGTLDTGILVRCGSLAWGIWEATWACAPCFTGILESRGKLVCTFGWGGCWFSSWLCFKVSTSTSQILSLLLPASSELKRGLSSSSTGEVGSLLASSSQCWLSRTGSLPALPPPTTGILLSPDAFAGGVFFSLGGPWRLVLDSLCSSFVLDDVVWAPGPPVLLGLTSRQSVDTCPLPVILAEPGASLCLCSGAEGREGTGQGAGPGAGGAFDTEIGL